MSSTQGLGILIEEKDVRSNQYQQQSLEIEALLPPLPSSSSSLPLPIDYPAELTKALVVSGVSDLPPNTVALQDSIIRRTDNTEMTLPSGSRSRSETLELEDRRRRMGAGGGQTLIQKVEMAEQMTNMTRHSSVSSTSSNKTVLKKIKSGLRKLSSPLVSTPKMETNSITSSSVEDFDNSLQQQFDNKDLTVTPPVFRKPFLPTHTSNLSNTSNTSSTTSSINPLSKYQHTKSTSLDSDTKTQTPISSPVITINEKFSPINDHSGYKFPTYESTTNTTAIGMTDNNNNNTTTTTSTIGTTNILLDEILTFNHYDTIDGKVSYIDSLKRQMEDEDAAYEITERRLLKSGWATELELTDLRKRREVLRKRWRESIIKLENLLYRN